MKKVFVVGGCGLTERMFANRSDEYELVDNERDADIFVFTGGADVHPSLYGELKHPRSYCNLERDRNEQVVFEIGKARGIVMAGICRGGQFLNVMSGGKMFQDVDQHALNKTHGMYYISDGKYDFRKKVSQLVLVEHIQVTSTHHQMMKPDLDKAEVWGAASRSSYRDEAVPRMAPIEDDSYPDIEIVWYPETKALCFQPHPEYGVESCENLFFKCLDRASAAP